MTFELLKLPYALGALEPHFGKETMEIHHDRRHDAYVTKLDTAVEGIDLKSKSTEEIVANLGSISVNTQTVVCNNGGGHLSYSLFQKLLSLSSEEKGAVVGKTKGQWGPLEEFKKEFTDKVTACLGSGWAWLVINNDQLGIVTIPDQGNPLIEGKTPILGLDVWEHAYYLKYQNKCPDYIGTFWNVVSWKKTDELYNATR